MYFSIPKLPFNTSDFDQTFYSEETFNEHLNFHHQAYVNNLNQTVSKLEGQSSLSSLLTFSITPSKENKLDQDTKQQLINFGGGHYNHSLFWLCLSPVKTQMSEDLEEKMIEDFGSLESFETLFKESALKVFGSGWTSLVFKDRKLSIMNTPNQDSPISQGYSTILTLDVWEHAYYLVYKHDRKSFVNEWFKHINWKNVSTFYKDFALFGFPVAIEPNGSVMFTE